jgi:hypothetical protein
MKGYQRKKQELWSAVKNLGGKRIKIQSQRGAKQTHAYRKQHIHDSGFIGVKNSMLHKISQDLALTKMMEESMALEMPGSGQEPPQTEAFSDL